MQRQTREGDDIAEREAIRLRKEGKSWAEIQKFTGMKRSALARLLKDAKLTKKRRKQRADKGKPRVQKVDKVAMANNALAAVNAHPGTFDLSPPALAIIEALAQQLDMTIGQVCARIVEVEAKRVAQRAVGFYQEES